MDYSFIIPVFDEAQSLKELNNRIYELAKKMGKNYEVIYIDDGSRDGSYPVLEELFKNDSHVKVIRFRHNTGKSAALNEGFVAAEGEIVITMDADLQDEPEEVMKMVEKLNSGYDMVSSWKKDRKDPLSKTLPSKIFNLVVTTFSGVKLHDFNSGLKVYKKEVVKDISLYGELHRFIPVIAAKTGFSVAEIPVIHHERKYGYSKYGWSRIPKGFLDFLTVLFLTNFEFNPLHFFGGLGFLLTFLGFIFGIYLSVLHFLGQAIGDRPLLILTILLILSGFQFIFTGLMAEMILHLSSRRKLPLRNVLTHHD